MGEQEKEKEKEKETEMEMEMENEMKKEAEKEQEEEKLKKEFQASSSSMKQDSYGKTIMNKSSAGFRGHYDQCCTGAKPKPDGVDCPNEKDCNVMKIVIEKTKWIGQDK